MRGGERENQRLLPAEAPVTNSLPKLISALYSLDHALVKRGGAFYYLR